MRKLKARFPEALALRGDVMGLPLADASAPCLVNIYNLGHMPFLDFALEEFSRVLTPRSFLLVSVHSVDGLAGQAGSPNVKRSTLQEAGSGL